MDLNLIRLFVTIVEAGTLSEAAARQGVTRSLVSRKLKELEAAMGAQLLRRTTRRIELTEQGRLIYDHGVRIAWELEAAQHGVQALSSKPKGHVRVSLPTGLSALNLRALLIQFSKSYPDLTLRVLFSNRVSDLIRSEIDVALRVVTDPPLDYVARKICNVDWYLYASPDYLHSAGPFAHPRDLMRADYLCAPQEGSEAGVEFRLGSQFDTVVLYPKLQTEDFTFLKEAATLGAGVTLLPDYMVKSELRAGLLQKVLPEYQVQGPGESLFILTTRNLYPSLAVKVVIQFLRQELRKLIEGKT